jgi:hypothetical protein
VEKSSSLEIAAITGFDCQKLLDFSRLSWTSSLHSQRRFITHLIADFDDQLI